MEAKTFEIRDRMTFIPALAVRLDPSNEPDRYLLARSGHSQHPAMQGAYVMLTRLGGDAQRGATADPCEWTGGSRTLPSAHQYIIDHWAELPSGAVVDVEFIRGEKPRPCVSEAYSIAQGEV